jgi:hypothetical protein
VRNGTCNGAVPVVIFKLHLRIRTAHFVKIQIVCRNWSNAGFLPAVSVVLGQSTAASGASRLTSYARKCSPEVVFE